MKDTTRFGKVIILGSMPHTLAVFGLLGFIFAAMSSGFLNGGEGFIHLTPGEIDTLLNAAIIFAGLSVTVLFMPYLLKKVDDPSSPLSRFPFPPTPAPEPEIADASDYGTGTEFDAMFQKEVIILGMATMPQVIGLIIAQIMIVDAGLI